MKYVRPFFSVSLRRLSFLVGSGLFLSVSHGGTLPAGTGDLVFGYVNYQATGQGAGSISYGSAGAGSVPGRALTLTPRSDGVYVSRNALMTNPSGNTFEVGTKAKIPTAAVGKLLGRALTAVPAIGIGMAIYDTLKEMNIDAKKALGGQLQLKEEFLQKTEGIDWSAYGAASQSDWCAKQAALRSSGPYTYTAGTPYPPVWDSWNGVYNAGCNATYWQDYDPSKVYPAVHSSSFKKSIVETAAEREISQEEVQKRLDQKTVWKDTSRVGDALADELARQPTPVQTEAPTVSGPSTSAGPDKKTTQADGTVTVEKTVHNHTYEGSTINTTNVTTVTNTTVNGGTTTTTTEEKPTNEKEQKTDCDKYPDNIGCSKYGETPVEVPLKNKTFDLSVVPQAFAGSAACPAPITFDALGKQYAIQYDPLCRAMDLIKPLIIAMAGLMAAYILADSFKV